MADILAALARVRREPFADDLPIAATVNQLCRDQEYYWRDRLFTPLLTLRLFVLQVLHGNTSIAHLRQLCGLDFAPSSYSDARCRLPLQVFGGLLESMLRWTDQAVTAVTSIGQRVFICDASSFSMSDTAELRERFGLPPSCKPGIGYPVAKLMGLMDAATGLFAKLLAAPLFTHDMRHVLRLHPSLGAGDILLGDRAYCTYVHLALLQIQGVFGCFRLHQRRPQAAGLKRWKREGKAPAWMSIEQFQLLPLEMKVRIIQYTLEQRGFRTRKVIVATTLLDEQAWPDEKIAELYGQRWQIETCFDHLKTTMKMNVLKCQSLDGVMKELAVYALVYNLVRLAMLRAAEQQQVSVSRISFVDALRWLCSRMLGLEGVERLFVNPYRPGRREPRVIRRRMKEYNLMKCPRAELKNMGNWGENR
jgi:hypothetical protein